MTSAGACSVKSAAKLLNSTPRALRRQLERNGEVGADGRITLDGVTARREGREFTLRLGQRWTKGGAFVAWFSPKRMAKELGVSRALLGKRLEPGRVGAWKPFMRLRIAGRDVVARRFGTLWKLRFDDVDSVESGLQFDESRARREPSGARNDVAASATTLERRVG